MPTHVTQKTINDIGNSFASYVDFFLKKLNQYLKKEPLYLKGSFAIYGAEGSRTPVQMPCYISVYNHRDCLNLTS